MQEIREDLKIEEPQVPVEVKKKKKFRLFGKKKQKEEEPAEGGKKTQDPDQE